MAMLLFPGWSPLRLSINLAFLRPRALLRPIALWVPFEGGKYFVLRAESSLLLSNSQISSSAWSILRGGWIKFRLQDLTIVGIPPVCTESDWAITHPEESVSNQEDLNLLMNATIWAEDQIPRWSHTLLSHAWDFDYEFHFCILSKFLRLNNDENCHTLRQKFIFASQGQWALAGVGSWIVIECHLGYIHLTCPPRNNIYLWHLHKIINLLL